MFLDSFAENFGWKKVVYPTPDSKISLTYTFGLILAG